MLPMLDARHYVFFHSSIALKFVSDDNPRHITQAFKQLVQETLGCVAFLGAYSDQLNLATALEASQNLRSDSFGLKPALQ
jgi:hypothetical protein